MNRKEFIRNGGRVVILSGIALATGWLVRNRQLTTSSRCSLTIACDRCGKKNCGKQKEA